MFQCPELPVTPEQRYRAKNPGVLRIYDPSLDEFRDATQDDLDRALVAARNGASIREQANQLHEDWKKRFWASL
jgi:hypothetical protein